MATPNDLTNVASGMAALSICESLILALGDLEIVGEAEAIGVITDAATAHRGAVANNQDAALNKEVVAILERIIAGGNSIRRS